MSEFNKQISPLMPLDRTPFANKPDFTVFHTSVWMDALLKAFPRMRDASRIVALPDGRRVLLSALETYKLGVWTWLEAMPFALFGGPVVEVGDLSATDASYLFAKFKKGTGLFSVNLDPLHRLAKPGLLGSGAYSLTTHLLRLESDFEAVEKQFTKTVRYDARNAVNKGVSARRGYTVADFNAYYELTHTASEHRTPGGTHFPKALFEAFAALPPDEVNLWLADFEGKVIGGLLVIPYAVGRSIYWGSAMHLDYTRLNPTKMLLREAIRTACERGDTILNMGPSAGFDGRPLDGVRQLKESFGGQPHDYAVGIYTNPWALRFRGITDRAKSLLKRTH